MLEDSLLAAKQDMQRLQLENDETKTENKHLHKQIKNLKFDENVAVNKLQADV